MTSQVYRAAKGLWQEWVLTNPASSPPPPPPAATPTALSGAAVGEIAGNASYINTFENESGRPLAERHLFFQGNVPSSLSSSLVAADAGVRKVLIDFELAKDGSQASALDKFLSSCRAGNLDAAFTLYHAPLSKGFTGPGDYASAIKPYVPVIRKYGYQHVFDLTNYQVVHKSGLNWWPGDSLVDAFGVEYYCQASAPGSGGDTLDMASSFADSHGVPFGLTEYGVDRQKFNQTQGDAFLAYILSFFRQWISSGKQLWDVIVWAIDTGASGATGTATYNFDTAPASYISYYQQIYDLVTGKVSP